MIVLRSQAGKITKSFRPGWRSGAAISRVFGADPISRETVLESLHVLPTKGREQSDLEGFSARRSIDRDCEFFSQAELAELARQLDSYIRGYR